MLSTTLFYMPRPHPSLSRKVSSLSTCGLSQLVTWSCKYFPTFQQLVTPPPSPLGGGRWGGACPILHLFSCIPIFHSSPPSPPGEVGEGGRGSTCGGGEWGSILYSNYSNLLLPTSWKLPLPWSSSLLIRRRGRGSGDNPYTWHNTYTSCARCPKESVTKSNPNVRWIVSFS